MAEKATILVVEDDDAVRLMLRRLLKHFGYLVLEASNGEEAWTLCESNRKIDLVITDLAMPRVSGLELIRRLVAQPHPPKVLVCCGSSGVLELPHLAKPFTSAELKRAVEQALA